MRIKIGFKQEDIIFKVSKQYYDFVASLIRQHMTSTE